jgi:hypothetical protein
MMLLWWDKRICQKSKKYFSKGLHYVSSALASALYGWNRLKLTICPCVSGHSSTDSIT